MTIRHTLLCILLLAAGMGLHAQQVATGQFLYENVPGLPQCHASTIVELKNGDLVAAYFAGKHEGNPDVCIWVSRKPRGSQTWDAPILAADGVFTLRTKDAERAGVTAEATAAEAGPIKEKGQARNASKCRRKACWNPVLYEMSNGELWLFFKVGSQVSDWSGWLCRSRNGGKSWGKKKALPDHFLGPIKNKPVAVGRTLVCGSSTELGGWRLHFELYNLWTRQWTYAEPLLSDNAPTTMHPDTEGPIEVIQPALLQLSDGRLKALCRTKNGRLAQTYGIDDGYLWSRVTLTDIPHNNSGIDAVTLSDGRHAMLYNPVVTPAGKEAGPRTPLCLAVSDDDGRTWHNVLTLEDGEGEYSYPALIEGRDGSLHCVYTWKREKIMYKQITW